MKSALQAKCARYSAARNSYAKPDKPGFTQAIIPKANAPKQKIAGIEIIAVERVEQAVVQIQ